MLKYIIERDKDKLIDYYKSNNLMELYNFYSFEKYIVGQLLNKGYSSDRVELITENSKFQYLVGYFACFTDVRDYIDIENKSEKNKINIDIKTMLENEISTLID